MTLRCETVVYQVAMKRPDVDDKDWFEYKVELWDGETLLDEWDSLVETYNGVEKQRLDLESAHEASLEIVEDVRDGNAGDWFNHE